MDQSGAHWIFQGNPKRYDLKEELIPGKVEPWVVTRYASRLRSGDVVWFWRSGERAIYGWGRIQEDVAGSPETDELSIVVRYEERFAHPIQLEDLQKNMVLAKLLVLRSPQGTNFAVTAEESAALVNLVEEKGLRAPEPVTLVLLPASFVERNSEADRFIDLYQLWPEAAEPVLQTIDVVATLFIASGGVDDESVIPWFKRALGGTSSQPYAGPRDSLWADSGLASTRDYSFLFDTGVTKALVSDTDFGGTVLSATLADTFDRALQVEAKLGKGLDPKTEYDLKTPALVAALLFSDLPAINQLLASLSHNPTASDLRESFLEEINEKYGAAEADRWRPFTQPGAADPLIDDQNESKLRLKDERVRTIADAPESFDRLGRRQLAESLATRLRGMYEKDSGNSFLLHIDGPWGAGKSTLLNFLRRELAKDWLVVNFNAWREQRSGPPWWALLTALRRSAYQKISGTERLCLRFSEFLARLRAIGVGNILGMLATASVTVGLLIWLSGENISIATVGSVAKSLAAIITLVLTVWQANVVLSRRILPGSPKSARAYIEANTDPMQGIAAHFQAFINRVDSPVMIFIDDLDRCREEYVVELLEAVQTLIREEPTESATEDGSGDQAASEKVVRKAPYFVVAADGRWIRASYEKAYSTFVDEVTELGRPLGYLFLDKVFQLTTTLPVIDPELQRKYMDFLLGVGGESGEADFKEKTDRAKKVLEETKNDFEILNKVEVEGGDDPLYKQALRGEAVKRMAVAAVSATTEHALQDFSDLLDKNPRSMKRFVNAYGVERALRTIEGSYVGLDQLARWTIVLLRWPILAERLQLVPNLVDKIGSDPGEGVPKDVRLLFTVDEIEQVIAGTKPEHGKPLDADAIRQCCGIFTGTNGR